MKKFTAFIAEKDEWKYMELPKKTIPAVDDYGRTIDTPEPPKKAKSKQQDDEKEGPWTNRDTDVFYSSPGTEEHAEKKQRTNTSGDYSTIGIPRKVGPTMKDAQREKDIPDIKKDTKDNMPNANDTYSGFPENQWRKRWINMKTKHIGAM